MKVNFMVNITILAQSNVDDELLIKGVLYEVESIDMGRYYTNVKLSLDGKIYNSLNFDFYYRVDKSCYKKIDIYKSALFNPYIAKVFNVEDNLCFVCEVKPKVKTLFETLKEENPELSDEKIINIIKKINTERPF